MAGEVIRELFENNALDDFSDGGQDGDGSIVGGVGGLRRFLNGMNNG